MKKELLLTAAIMASITGTTFAAGTDFGVNSVNDGSFGVVTGTNNIVNNGANNTLVSGYGNKTNASNTLVMGEGNTASAMNSFVGGENSQTRGKNSIAFGENAQTNFDNTFAIGKEAVTSQYDTIAIGNGAKVSGESSVAIGRDNNITAADTTAFGANNGTIAANQSNVFGYNNVVQGTEKEQLIFGVNSTTKEQGATVVGSHAQATAIDAVALGNNTVADVQNSVAIGTNSTTDNAVGTSTIKDNTTDIRFMNSSYAGENPDSVVSFGTNGRAGAGGVTSYTRQLQNVAAGRVSSTSTDAINGSQLYDVALEAQKYNTVVDGTNTTVASADNAFGRKEYKVNVNKDLNGMNSVNFGSNTDSVRGTVSKNGAQFFNGSVNTNVTTNGIQIEDTDSLEQANFTKQGMYASEGNKTVYFTTNGVSAGDQIINGVKAGVAGTDAVNVDQLNKVAADVNKKVNSVGKTVVKAGSTNAKVDSAVSGNTTTYTVDVSPVLSKMRYIGLDAATNAPGDNRTYLEPGKTRYITDDYDNVVTGKSMWIANTETLDNTTYDITGVSAQVGNTSVKFTTDGIDAGMQNITRVAAGVDDTDAVNVSQLKKYVADNDKDTITTVKAGDNVTVTNDGNHNYTVAVNKDVDLTEDGSLTIGNSKLDNQELTIKSSDDRITTINGTGMGIDGTDGSTLVAVGNVNLENKVDGSNSVIDTHGITAEADGRTVSFTTDGISAGDQKINNVKAGVAGTDAVNVDQLNKAIKDNRTVVEAGDNIVVKEDAGTYTVSTAKDLTGLNSVSLNDGNNESTYTTEGINMTYRGADDEYHTSYKYDGVHITTNDGDANPVNEVSLTDKGLNNGGNRITKVGKGIDGDDGVNVNQLRDELAKNKAVESVVADNQVDNIAAVRVTNGKSTGDANAQYGVYVSRSTVDAIAKASNRFAGDDVINVTRWDAPANVADLTTFKYNGEKAATKTPLSYKANGKDAKQVMLADGLDFTNGKNTTVTTDANGVVKYSVNDNLNGMKSVNFDGGTTVNNDGLTINNGPSVTKDGIDAGNKTITNVAPGRVEAGSTDAINGSQLNDAAQRISNRYDAAIANNQREISKVGARAAAMANLHYQDFNADDKWSFAAGYGHYKGQNAGAIGVAYQPNENTMITASTTIGKDAMYGAGVSMKFGKSSKMNTNKQVAMAKEIEELRAIVAAQNAKIDALVDHAMGKNEAITDVVFPDVPENHWAYNMVQDLAYKGIVVGYPDNTFSGDRTLTRYEFAVALDRAISAGYMNPELGRAIKEFKVELDQVQKGMRFRVDRASGKDGATDKVERVRVNKDNTRDNYGTVVK